MGFYDDIMQIVKFLPKERQTIMFSATMLPRYNSWLANILNNPAEVKLAVSKTSGKDCAGSLCLLRESEAGHHP